MSDGCCAGEVFVQCMELALRIPSCCKSVAVYSKVLSFLHRMIELLGELILPYLQPAFDVTLSHTFPVEIHLCCRFFCKRDKKRHVSVS